jgi:hypothetical protein
LVKRILSDEILPTQFMAYIIETPNPFEPLKMVKHIQAAGISIREWVDAKFPDKKEFPQPTICIVNGDAVMREGWSYRLKEDDVVNFITLPGYEFIGIIIAIVIALVMVVVTLLMAPSAPVTPGETPASDPVYTVKGQQNSIRLGEPIENSYGRNRIYPSYASRPYYEYRDNDQYQFSLFCIGQGEYELEEIKIGDTLISSFQEVQYEIIPPAGQVTVFPTNVYTSSEAGGQKVLASNQEDYPLPDGWVGPFVANPANTEATQLQIDLVLPKGLYHAEDSGSLAARSLTVQIQARTIDAAGNPIGSWVTFFAGKQIEIYTATSRTLLWRGAPSTSWVWAHTSTTYTPWVGGDPVQGTVTTVYSDAGNNDPTNRDGVTKTVTTISTATDALTITGKTTTPQRRTYRTSVTAARYEVRMRRTDVFDDSYRSGHDVEWGGMRTYLDEDPVFGAVTMLAVIIRASNNLNSVSQKQLNVLCTRKLLVRESAGWTSAPVATRSIVWAFVDIFRGTYGAYITDDVFFDWDAFEALDAVYAAREDYFDFCFRDAITVWEGARTVARVGRAVPMLVGSLISIKRDAAAEIPVTLFTPDNIIKDTFEWGIKLWDLGEFDSILMEYTDPTTGYKQEQVHATLPGGTTDRPQNIRFIGCQDRTRAYREALHLLAVDKYLRDNITFETGLEGHILSYGDLFAFAHDVPNWGQAGYVVHAVHIADNWYHLYVSEPLDFAETAEYQIALRGRAGEQIGPFTARETADSKQVRIQSDETTMDFLLGGTTEPMLFLFGTVAEVTRYWKAVKVEPLGGERIRVSAVNSDDRIYSYDTLVADPLNTPPAAPQAPALPVVASVTITQIGGVASLVQVLWPPAFGAQYYVVQTSEDGENWQERAILTRTSIQLQVFLGTLYVRVAGVNEGQGPWATGSLEISSLAVVPAPPTTLSAVIQSEESDQVCYTLHWTVPAIDNLVGLMVWLSETDGFDPEVVTPVVDEAISSPGYLGIPTSTVVCIPLDSAGGHAVHYWRVTVYDVNGDGTFVNITSQQTISAYPA